MKKILVMGLPGSGKTYFASELKKYLEQNNKSVMWLNADEIRKHFNDWDFSKEGRIRQSIRMATLAEECSEDYVICDFVAPLTEMRNNFKAEWTIWMDTIDQGRFEDTNKMFIAPDVYDFRINEKSAEKWSEYVGFMILNEKRRPTFDWKKETVQMLGRWQPWHQGHRALFERAITKTGQVVIQIRDCQGWQGSNPFAIDQVKGYIRRDLDPLYQGMYEIQVVPNIVNITYGRDVGYKIEKEEFDSSITNISATKIRESMNLS
jgi:phosphopantetheine adenylyltransferase